MSRASHTIHYCRNEIIREASHELNIEWQKLLAEVIEAGVATGEFIEVDVEAVSWKALSLLDGLELQLVAHPTVLERSKAAQSATSNTERDLGLRIGTLTGAVSTA